MKNKHLLVILLISSFAIKLITAFNIPLFSDEIDIGYQAFSLLKTGKDYSGNTLPTYIQSFTEYRAPLQMYLTVPFVKVLGLSSLAIRLPVILSSLLGLYLVYKLFGLSASFFMALSPWHIHYSSIGFEVSVQLTLILLGIYFFTKKPLLSAITFALCFYTYSTSNILVPLIIIFLSIFNKTNLKIFYPVLILFCLPILFNLLSGDASSRFNQISIFSDPRREAEVVFKRTGFSSPGLASDKLIYNKVAWTISTFLKNYIQSLSPLTIFASGDSFPRHSTPGFGFFLLSTLPLALLGLAKLKDKLILFLLLVLPVASSLTQSGATHGTRLYLLSLPLAVLISLGYKNLNNISKNIFYIIFAFNFISFFYEYHFYYPKEQFIYFNTGYKELLSDLPISNITISNSNYNAVLPFLFYNRYDPNKIIASKFTTRPNKNDQLVLDNITFQNQPKNLEGFLSERKAGEYLLLWQKEDIPGDWDFSKGPPGGYKSIKTVYLPNRQILGQLIQKI